MTEEEWLAIGSTREKLAHLSLSASVRKLRLFAGACCRRMMPYFKDSRSLQLIEISDQFADGSSDITQLEDAFAEAADAQEAIHWESDGIVDLSAAESVLGLRHGLDFDQVISGTLECAGAVTALEAWGRIWGVTGRDPREQQREDEEATEIGVNAEVNVQHAFLCDIFGNPFRPVVFDPAWRTSTTIGIATGIYDDRAFDRMPILADALQDAGCENEDILTHCRGDSPHVRGCWVVDLVLGKE